MTSSFMLHQLYILRSQVELLIVMAEAAAPPNQGPSACEHPEDRRMPASNMGEEPKFFCQVCRETVKEPV